MFRIASRLFELQEEGYYELRFPGLPDTTDFAAVITATLIEKLNEDPPDGWPDLALYSIGQVVKTGSTVNTFSHGVIRNYGKDEEIAVGAGTGRTSMVKGSGVRPTVCHFPTILDIPGQAFAVYYDGLLASNSTDGAGIAVSARMLQPTHIPINYTLMLNVSIFVGLEWAEIGAVTLPTSAGGVEICSGEAMDKPSLVMVAASAAQNDSAGRLHLSFGWANLSETHGHSSYVEDGATPNPVFQRIVYTDSAGVVWGPSGDRTEVVVSYDGTELLFCSEAASTGVDYWPLTFLAMKFPEGYVSTIGQHYEIARGNRVIPSPGRPMWATATMGVVNYF